jgi:hypothetical protein
MPGFQTHSCPFTGPFNILPQPHISLNVKGEPRIIIQYTDKKGNQIFLIYKEIQNGAVAKSYMTHVLLLSGEIFAHFLIY